ncbi:MAG: hypothetical protein ACRCXT_17015 [Paraclostridium sp.]
MSSFCEKARSKYDILFKKEVVKNNEVISRRPNLKEDIEVMYSVSHSIKPKYKKRNVKAVVSLK